MSEPVTPMGKRVLELIQDDAAYVHVSADDIATIEREARALGPDHSVEIARNLVQQHALAAEAIRTTDGPAGRCYEMADGRLLTIANPQPAGSTMLHSQWVLPVTREDAEDFYGWSPGPEG